METSSCVSAHVETIEELCSIAGAGKLTEKEVLDLAYFLNEHRDARHAWPGEKLFSYLHAIFYEGHVSDTDCAHVCEVLEMIELECARIAPAHPEDPPIPETAVRSEEIVLPTIEKRVKVESLIDRGEYDVDLNLHTCGCPGRYGNRRHYPRHGFNTKEKRWVFGARPKDAQPIEGYLLEAAAGNKPV